MAAEETLPYGRSPSRASRIGQDTVTLDKRSFFGQKSSRKSQQKTTSDKLVWFSPVHSPLLSPGREKAVQIAKRKVRPSSIFSIQSRAKGSIEEAEEPTSPKVSCIGQVRAHKKDKDPFADASKKKIPQSKPGSMSPARFFASPGRSSKWGSLFGSRKDSCASPSSTGYGVDYQVERQNNPWAAVDGYFDRYTHDEADPHVFVEARAPAGVDHNIPLKKGASAYEKSHVTHDVKSCDADRHAGPDKSLQEQRHHGKPPISKQRLTYEELPSLHCSASAKQNMKISVEVVPETWLWRNGERLRPDSTSHLNSVPDRSTSTSREEPQKAQEEEVNTPASPHSQAQPCIREAEECADYQILLSQPENTSSKANIKEDKSSFTSVDAGLLPIDDTTYKSMVGNEKKNDAQQNCTDESHQLHLVSLPPRTHMGAPEEKLRSRDGGSGGNHQARVLLHCDKLKGEVDLEKHQFLLGSSDVKSGHHRTLRRVGLDVGGQNYGFPQLAEKKLSSNHSNEDGKRLWSIFKGRKSEAFSAQPFSALILVGYDQPINSTGHKVTNDEELLKGILEVGRLSFHGTGKYFQVLKSDAEFIRSRSATSHRTVIRLQRCNSDPCRPSC
eukprot:c23689_g2_i1 orf=229-2067(+)